jgi:uncharacterized membrane protein
LCIDNDFIREVEDLMKPGTSALFLLDEVGNCCLDNRDGIGEVGRILREHVAP